MYDYMWYGPWSTIQSVLNVMPNNVALSDGATGYVMVRSDQPMARPVGLNDLDRDAGRVLLGYWAGDPLDPPNPLSPFQPGMPIAAVLSLLKTLTAPIIKLL